jgi:hypothetical protein
MQTQAGAHCCCDVTHKAASLHTMKSYEGVELQLHTPGCQMEVNGHCHMLAALPWGKEPLVPIE